jgi:hypothetical protein
MAVYSGSIFRRVSIWNTFPSEVIFPTFNKLKAGKKTCQEVLKMTGYYVLFGETFQCNTTILYSLLRRRC